MTTLMLQLKFIYELHLLIFKMSKWEPFGKPKRLSIPCRKMHPRKKEILSLTPFALFSLSLILLVFHSLNCLNSLL